MAKLSGDLQTPDSRWLTIEDFEYLCFNLAKQLLEYKEPIPDYSTRDNALLESALGSPKHTFGGELLYPTLVKQAAILFYSLIKNHPFKNGNKRIAVMALLVFLKLNNKWIAIKPYDLYLLACKISNSKQKNKDMSLRYVEKVLKKSITDLKNK